MKLYFIDFEASSLDSGSFPIEVAWVDANGQGESYLIKPQPTWTNWSAQSQAIHGIARETLDREGLSAEHVANRVMTALKGAVLISDNPTYDQYWLHVLTLCVTPKRFSVRHLNMLIARQIERLTALNEAPPETAPFWRRQRLLLDEAQILVAGAVETTKLGHKTQHRALPDAEHLWQQWKAAKAAIDRRLLLAGQADH